MAIIGSAEVEVRADVRKLGKDVTDSFKGLEKQADEIADRMGKSIADGIRDNLDGLTLQVDIDQDYFLDQARQVEDTLGVLRDEAVKIKVEVDADEVLDLAILMEDLSGTVKLDIDQDHFSRQVLFAEDTLGNLMDSEVPVTITADTDSLLKLADDVRNIVDSIPESSRTVKYEPKLAPGAQNKVTEDVSKILDQARAAADNFDFEMSVDADIDEARATLEELQEKIEDEELEIGITYSKSDLEQLNGAIETLRQYNEANAIELEVDIHITKAMAKLALLARNRTMKILPEIGGSFVAESSKMFAGLTGLNVMRDDFKSFIESLTQLDVQLKGLVTQLLLVSAAVPAVGWMSGWAVTLIGDLGTLSGLLVPLAGLLGGAAIGGGTLAIALMGTGDRLDDLVPKFESFRDVISNTYWGVAEAPLRNMIDKVLPPLQVELETTSEALGVMSTALFDAITNIATSPEGQGAFSTIIGNTNIAIKKLGPAFEPFLRGLLNLSAIGSQFLPEISDWVVSIAEKFEAWTQNTEEIETWAKDAIEIMKALFSIVGSTVGIMKTLYGVAQTAGFPGVRELATGLEDINKEMAKPANVEFLTNLATSVTTAMDSIIDGLSWVGPLIMEHADGIGEVIETMGSIIGKVFEGIGRMLTETGLVEAFFGLFESLESGVDTFFPVFENLGVIFKVTLDMLGKAIEEIAPVLEVFFQNLENDAVLVKPALEGILEVVGEWGPKVMEVVGKVTKAIAEFIGGLDPVLALLGLAFVALLPVIASIGAVLIALGGAIGSAVGGFIALWGWISALALGGGALGTVFTTIGVFILDIGENLGKLAGRAGGVFSGIAGAAGTAVGGIRTFFAPLTGWIGGLFATMSSNVGLIFQGLMIEIRAVLSPITTFVSGLFSRLAGNVGLIFQGLMIEIRTLLGPTLTGIFSRIGTAIGTLLGSLGNLGGKGFGGLLSKITSFIPGIGWIISAFITAFTVSEDLRKAVGGFLVNAFITLAALIEPILGPIKNLFGVLMEVSMEIGQVLAPAFTSVFNIINSLMPVVILVAKVIGEVLGAAITLLVGAIKGAWAFVKPILSGVVTFVSAVFNGIAGIISGVIDVIVNLFTGDFAGALESLKGIGDTVMEMLKGAFDGIAEAFFGVFEGLVGSTKETFTAIGDAILGVLDGFGLGEAGQAIIQSLIDGFANMLDTVIGWLQDLTQWIIDSKGPPSKDATLLTSAGESIIQSLINGFMNIVGGVIDFLTGLTQSIVDIVMGIGLAIATSIQTGWGILTTVVSGAFNNVLIVIQTVFTIIWTFITTAVNNVVIVFQTGWNLLTGIVTNVLLGIVTIVMTYFTAIKTNIQIIIQGILNVITIVFTGIFTVISTIWNSIRTASTVVWNAIKALIKLGLAALKALFTGNFSAFLSIISKAWDLIKSTTSSVWNIIKNAIKSVLTTIFGTISNVFNSITSTISSVMSNILSTISSIWNTIKSTIANVLSSMISSISNGLSRIKSNMSNAWNTIKRTLSNAWQAMVSNVQEKITTLISKVKAIPGKAKSALGNLKNTLRSAGKDIIQGLIDGVTGMIGTLRDKFSGITNMIPDWKGPPDTDAKLLTNAGELIMEGLISGLESKYGAVKDSLQGFTGDLSQTVRTNVGADIGLSTSVRRTALSDAERRLAYRSNSNSMVESKGGDDRQVHIHFHNAVVNESEIITVVNRELGRGV